MSNRVIDYTVVDEFTIKPGEIVECCVGIYESVLPQPRLSVEFQPSDIGGIRSSLVRIDGNGDYTLMYHFENDGAALYVVTIRAGWPDGEYNLTS